MTTTKYVAVADGEPEGETQAWFEDRASALEWAQITALDEGVPSTGVWEVALGSPVRRIARVDGETGNIDMEETP